MPRRPLLRVAACGLVLACTSALAACSSSTATDDTAGAGGTTGSSTQGSGTLGNGTTGEGVASSAPELVVGMRDGVWPVGSAGEIEFTLDERGLELVQMRPADGWRVTAERVGPDEIEVDLASADVRATVEVSVQADILEIEVDESFDPPPAGPLPLGEAGTVVVTVEGTTAVLTDVMPADGWRVSHRSDAGSDAALGLRRNGAGVVETWEVSARVDDGGLEVGTDYEIAGRTTG